ncbi:tetratricopeptide repeat protein [uncultured Dubosiella sp.]|uniref:tetratricopeptide repeat protein n=1 Tax=uncultured Dubosiella sp. TaxID=1937011 RepID=UPI0025B5ADCA|nr:tetratricopeptide repeat protein [uncultured Dubosiella sp.]
MKNTFYPHYIKWLRDFFYIGQSEIADALYMSVSTYSKMEQGKKTIQDEDFSAIIRFYEGKKEDYSFCFDEEKKEKANALIRQCIVSFVYRSQKEMLPELENYLSDSANLHSFAFFETKLLEMIYEYFADLSFQERLPFLLEHLDLFNTTAQSMIYDLYGLSKLRTYDETAIECFQTAKSLSVLLNIPGWLGLIDHHLILTYLRFMNPEKAFTFFEECGREFQNAGAHRRLLNLRFNQAHCFAKLGLFDESEQIYINLIQTYNQVDTKRFVAMVYSNYSWSKLVQKNYTEALHLAKKAMDLKTNIEDVYITLAYSNYQLGQPEDALDAIAAFRRQNRKDPRSKMVLKFLEVLENFLLGRKKTFERLASQLLLQLEKWRDLEVDLFVYQMLIDHYTGMEDEHSLCVVQAKLIDFLMH